jgi:phosphatidylserine/phosphatidylglycerophosphate/cardiolipin synthase-like enzyme
LDGLSQLHGRRLDPSGEQHRPSCFERTGLALPVGLQRWRTGNLKGSGKNNYGSVTVGKTPVEFAFAPGEGSAVASLFVDAIQGAGARGNVHIASMVLSSGPILGALVDHLRAGGGITGIYDGPQMRNVEGAWRGSKTSGAKLASWNVVKRHLVAKASTPYTPTGVHDFMHNKLLVTSKVVLTGSFNLSRNAESNAENVLSIHDPKLAGSYVRYIDSLVQMYTVRRSKAA